MKTGIYIHIPFCRKKCNYCDFVSKIADYTDRGTDFADRGTDVIDKYLRVLADEFALHFTLHTSHFTPTLYIGGGTPSILSEKQLEFLFKNIAFPSPFSPATKLLASRLLSSALIEFTFEANPESLTESKLRILKTIGVNRLSIGLQSFDDELLSFLGRVHTVDNFIGAYNLSRKVGFQNINIDLIFGIAGQTLSGWISTLKKVVSLNPEHISVYSLTIEKGTKFFEAGLKKDDDLDADMYEAAIRFLKESDYHHYEISNFAKPGFECQHNINYWKNGEYLGFGLGAVSYIEGKRIKTTENLTDYLNGKFRTNYEELNSEQKISEDLILGLRLTDGIKVSDTIKEKFSYQIENLINNKLLLQQGDFLKLTDKGIMFANCVFREFVE